MIVLDTNVVYAAMLGQAEPSIVRWLNRQPPGSLWFTTICQMEIDFGIRRLAPGRRRDGLERTARNLAAILFEDRMLTFDLPAADAASSLQAQRERMGRIVPVIDTMIAGIAISRGATLATRNTRHFADAGIRLVNPFDPVQTN